jgi:hypothetical protein
MITVPKAEVQRELIPQGNYLARCYKMIEIGTIDGEYQGVANSLHKVRIGWELPTELKVFKEENGEQPLVIDKEYTLSLGEKASLRKDLKSWRGKDFTQAESENFDISVLLGVPCLLNIIHSPKKTDPTKFYQAIGSISPLPKGMVCPDAINPKFEFSLNEFDKDKFNSLPEFIRKQIESSKEYKALFSENKDVKQSEAEIETNVVYLDDNMPF